jgi:LPS export ABC transporter protein LptC
MMKNSRNLLWIIPLALFVTSPLWKPSVATFLKPRGGYDPQLAARAARQQQNFVMDSITLTLTNMGKEEWLINARRAFTGKTDRELGMIDVDALYHGKDQPVIITSNRGTYFLDDRHLILIDNVVIRKPQAGEVLYTDLLHYYDATKMLVSPVDVDIKSPKFTLQAGRMDYDLATDGYEFSNGVTVEL